MWNWESGGTGGWENRVKRLSSNILAPFSPLQGEASSRISGPKREHSSEESWVCLSARLPKIPAEVMNW